MKPETQNLTDEAIMAALERPGEPPEGRFFPDTYTYAKGSSDLAVLRRALHAMDRKLDAAWAQRAPDTPLKTPQEALILASIVEKETGKPADRALIAGVFTNRLRSGMLLQTRRLAAHTDCHAGRRILAGRCAARSDQGPLFRGPR